MVSRGFHLLLLNFLLLCFVLQCLRLRQQPLRLHLHIVGMNLGFLSQTILSKISFIISAELDTRIQEPVIRFF
jgi:hypothetical protein